MDNRVGAFVALEAARLVAADRGAADVYAVATAQEEITFGGAYTASFSVAPMVAIAIDVTHATDYPGADKKRNHEVKLGGGPVLGRGATINDGVFHGLREAARTLGIETAVQATGKSTGTDADAMIRSGTGTATGVVSIPNRYMHSPNELVSLSDLENAARIIAGFIQTLTTETDFRPGSSRAPEQGADRFHDRTTMRPPLAMTEVLAGFAPEEHFDPSTNCTEAIRVKTTAAPLPMASTRRSDGQSVTIADGRPSDPASVN